MSCFSSTTWRKRTMHLGNFKGPVPTDNNLRGRDVLFNRKCVEAFQEIRFQLDSAVYTAPVAVHNYHVVGHHTGQPFGIAS